MKYAVLKLFFFFLVFCAVILSCKKKGDIEINQVSVRVENCSLPYIVDFNVDLTYEGKEIDYTWDFGDGTTSKDKNPVHVYNKTGLYVAKLIIKNYHATKEETVTVNIQTESLPVISDFSYISNYNFFAPAEIIFQNNSQYATSFLWDFGDGYQSDDVEAIHIYDAANTYNVSLRSVCNGDTVYHTEAIRVYPPPADITIKSVKVWLPAEHLNKELRLRIYYDIFNETPMSLNSVFSNTMPVTWNMYQELFFFNGSYDADLLKFEIWDVNYTYAPLYTFAIPTIEIARNHYPTTLTWNDNSEYAAEVELDYSN